MPVRKISMGRKFDPQEEILIKNLRRFREEAGLTQDEAALASGVPIDNIRRYENGGSVPGTLPLRSLAEVYGHSMDDFFLDKPPAANLSNRPMFLLRTMPGVEVNPELLAQVKAVLDKVNSEARELAAKKKRPK